LRQNGLQKETYKEVVGEVQEEGQGEAGAPRGTETRTG